MQRVILVRGNELYELNNLLKEGWRVAQIFAVPHSGNSIVAYFVLENN